MTQTVEFNRRPLVIGDAIDEPDERLVRNTLGLVNASAEDAIRYGGEVTRAAMSAVRLRNDRRYVVVDVKVHMLMPGFCPAIPGWHTDGVPRDASGSPQGSGPPNLDLQSDFDEHYSHYHLLVTGCGCQTEFIAEDNIDVAVPADPSPDLYAAMTKHIAPRVALGALTVTAAPSCRVVEWDWWRIHQGVPARVREWRYLIRVTETDFLAPDTNLRRVVRTQQQVYAPMEFGW